MPPQIKCLLIISSKIIIFTNFSTEKGKAFNFSLNNIKKNLILNIVKVIIEQNYSKQNSKIDTNNGIYEFKENILIFD